MLPYLIPFLFTLFSAIRYDINNRKDAGNIFIFGFLFIYLTLLIGLRYRIGGDSLTYEAVYDHEKDLSTWYFTFFHIYQPGFTFLFALAKSISTNFVSFQLLHILLFNILLFTFLWKQTKYRFIALFIIEYAVYLYFTTEVLRESLAVLVFALNYPNYKYKKWIKFYIGVFISILFHISAVVLIILPLLHSIRFDRRYIMACLGMIIAIPIFLKIFGTAGGNMIADKVSSYSGKFYGIFATFTYVLPGGIFPLFILWLLKKKKHELRFENMICIQVLFGLAAIVNPLIFGRCVNYFVLFFMLTLADYFHYHILSAYKAVRRNSYIVLLFLFLVYSPQYLYLNKYIRYIPYSSVFNPKDINRDYNIEVN